MAQFSMAYVSIITNEHILLKITLFTEICSYFGYSVKFVKLVTITKGS